MRIGILSDMSRPHADDRGPGSLLAAQMAVEDYGGNVAGRKIGVISAVHENKVDIGTNIARKWFESGGVDAIFDVPKSSIAFAISDLDHADSGLIQARISVIDANKTERDGQMSLRNLRELDRAGKAAQRPTFPHPA